MKNYMRKYWHTHPEQYKKQKKRMPKNNKTYMIKYKTILLKLIGDKCVICGSTEHLFFHEIHGVPHRLTIKYYREHYQDFITLCYKHHRIIHIINEQPQILNYLIK
jgi:hypothetical protein